jgi:transcriptional regulator with PAS, ATPase and Fis domain
MQAKLLRVLQDGDYTPLGNNVAKQADVMIVAATNKDYREEIRRKRLRQDFFYRIGVIEISVPPLRERKEDLALLTEHILEQFRHKQAERQGRFPENESQGPTTLPGELTQALYTYDWPGNVRELQNLLQRYLATRDHTSILAILWASQSRNATADQGTIDTLPLPEALEAVEKQMIADMLARNDNHPPTAAKKLGIPLHTLYRRIRKYHLVETSMHTNTGS